LKNFGRPLEYQNISCFGTPKTGVPKLYSIPFFRNAAGVVYRLVWVTELSLAAIGLVFPALVLGYKSLHFSMYQVPVPMLIEKFVGIYFKQLLLVASSILF
jgi:hypothetical protein